MRHIEQALRTYEVHFAWPPNSLFFEGSNLLFLACEEQEEFWVVGRMVETFTSIENLACRRSGEKKKTNMLNHMPSNLIAAESFGSSMKRKFSRVGWVIVDSKVGDISFFLIGWMCDGMEEKAMRRSLFWISLKEEEVVICCVRKSSDDYVKKFQDWLEWSKA